MNPSKSMKASSATAGFFQTLPDIPYQYTSSSSSSSSSTSELTKNTGGDETLQRILALYMPNPIPQEVDKSLHEIARISLSPSTLQYSVDAEINTPYLRPLTTFGLVNEVDALKTGEGWRKLKDIGIEIGTVALGYQSSPSSSSISQSGKTWNRRVHQFAANHLWSGSAALTTCPAAMSDGAALLLGVRLNDADGDQPGRGVVLSEARKRLISSDPGYAWTSGQWMTERSGGSSVSETETVASRMDVEQLQVDSQRYGSDKDQIGMSLGPWKVDGFKWFSSATDANMVILLARTANGISTFYAPMRRKRFGVDVMNGVRISRLKNKLGTKALPTSELEIQGMRAWLVGEEGKGVREIGAILNATRLWTATGSVAGWARGLAISRAYSGARRIRNNLLTDNEQHMKWMSDETIKYRAAAHFAFLGTALNGIAEQGLEVRKGTLAASFLPNSQGGAEMLLRLLTPIMKAQCSLATVDGLRACMESLGGLGYCENNEDGSRMNVARLFRDANVNPIWEGTVSVMAEDLIRVVKGRDGAKTLEEMNDLIHHLLEPCQQKYGDAAGQICTYWQELRQSILKLDAANLLYKGRSLLRGFESLVCASLLLFDAVSDGDNVAEAVAMRWVYMRFGQNLGTFGITKKDVDMDRRIFFNDSVAYRNIQAHL